MTREARRETMFKTRIIPALMAAAIALPGAALAAGGEQKIKDVAFSYEGPFGTYDKYQLQRGFQVFHEVCSACHGLKYLSFRELGGHTGPAFPDEQVKAIAALYDVYDAELGDTRPGLPSDKFPANTDAGAPDLSLMAKARAGFHGPMGLGLTQLIKGIGGGEYIYSVLTEYSGEEIEEAGATLYENHAFAGGKISMPPPLSEGLVEYAMHGGEEGAETLESPEASVEQMAADVSAFLMWAAEPQLVERKASGFRNILFLLALTVLLYFTNKALWAKVKRKE
jgi:ubiquinol-cytochrome c reductase cytochrome c1 subunit